MRRELKSNNSASMGINAMIIFVALVLVSSVISIVMIKIGQQIFEDSENDASKTQDIIYGKIFVSSVIISAVEFDGNGDPQHANLLISLELTPGSPSVDDDLVKWAVLCPVETGVTTEDRWSNEGNLEAATTASGDGGDVGAIDELIVGTVYMISISLQQTTDADGDGVMDTGGCPPNHLEVHTLIFGIGGTGSYTSWDLSYDDSLSLGERVI